MPDDGPPDCKDEYTEAGSDGLIFKIQSNSTDRHKYANPVYK